MNEDKIRKSKEIIPKLNDNLKQNIIEEYDLKTTKKQRKTAGFKLIRILAPILSSVLILFVVSLSIIASVSIKDSGTGMTEDHSSTPASTFEKVISGYDIKDGGLSLFDYISESTSSRSDDDYIGDKDSSNSTIYTPSQLTSSCVDDNIEYDYFKSLLTYTSDQKEGKFKIFYDEFSFKTLNRIKITVPNDTQVKISLLKNNNPTFTGVSNKNGVCYIFSETNETEYNIRLEYKTVLGETKTLLDTITGDKDYTDIINESNNEKFSDLIELMVVIDTTGSMGDEIKYLQTELLDVIDRIKKDNPNTRFKLSVIAYKDKGDEYITKTFNFSENLNDANTFLSKLSASGGGDFEEAVEIALDEATKSNWSSESSTKILLFVADAPSHDKDVDDWNRSALKLSEKGVRIITVASSGIDTKTEYFFRSQSILTGGIYGFLTDDSGIGGSHLIASTEEPKTVEYLNDMLVRLINGYHTGIFTEAVPYRTNDNIDSNGTAQ
ncbi:VWA domain-containing protein [bacterium]|nr:VWA domain-containing protein [bacterium]